MTHAHSAARRRLLTVAALAAVPFAPAPADVGQSTIPLAPHGDTDGGPVGSVTPVAPGLFVLSGKGPDAERYTADDVLLVVEWDDSTSTVTEIAAPYSSGWGGGIAVASATRAALDQLGADGSWGTADDGIFVLDRIGSGNALVPVAVGHLDTGDAHAPVWLDPRTLVLTTRGPDGQRSSADDRVALVTDVGGANVVTYLPTPYTPAWSRGRPVALSPTSFLLTSNGPDGTSRTSDDLVYLFTDVGGANLRADLPTPNLFDYGASVPVRLTGTRAVLAGAGVDARETTGDDVVFVLDGLGTSNTVTAVPVPSILRAGGGMGVRLDASAAYFGTAGEDGREGTADDEIVAVHDIGGDVRGDGDVVGGLAQDAASRPLLLDANTAAVAAGGPDGLYGTADDEIVIVDRLDLGPGVILRRVPVPGLSSRVVSRPVPVGNDSFLVSHGGPDGDLGTADDRVTLVTHANGAPTYASVVVPGALDPDRAGHRARLLGHGHAAIVCPGADGAQGSGGDDLCLVLHDLPAARDLVLRNLDVRFNVAKPAKAATFTARATLAGDGFVPFDGQDVTISVGNAAQTIEAARFRGRKGVWTYADARRRRGFVTKVTWNARKGALTVTGKGVGTGVETTDPEWVPFSVTAGEQWYADSVAATPYRLGFRFRR